jgi:hypothetical protein
MILLIIIFLVSKYMEKIYYGLNLNLTQLKKDFLLKTFLLKCQFV